jgi:hypothetical protein
MMITNMVNQFLESPNAEDLKEILMTNRQAVGMIFTSKNYVAYSFFPQVFKEILMEKSRNAALVQYVYSQLPPVSGLESNFQPHGLCDGWIFYAPHSERHFWGSKQVS